jgi:signal transduction histidine kinase
VLQVSDNGGGIPDHLMSHLFDPFFSTKATERGERGLGLSIVHGIVVRHHGTIRVESVPHQGTTFTVYLPTIGAPDPIGTGSP